MSEDTRCVFCGTDLTSTIVVAGQKPSAAGYVFDVRDGNEWLRSCGTCLVRALRRYYSIRKYERKAARA